jgi:hypothetical protein
MMLLVLGGIDLFFAIMMLLAHYEVLASWRIAVAALIYWSVKGIILRGSILSFIDVLAGVYFVMIMLGVQTPIVYLFLGMMLYKMIVSLILRGS